MPYWVEFVKVKRPPAFSPRTRDTGRIRHRSGPPYSLRKQWMLLVKRPHSAKSFCEVRTSVGMDVTSSAHLGGPSSIFWRKRKDVSNFLYVKVLLHCLTHLPHISVLDLALSRAIWKEILPQIHLLLSLCLPFFQPFSLPPLSILINFPLSCIFHAGISLFYIFPLIQHPRKKMVILRSVLCYFPVATAWWIKMEQFLWHKHWQGALSGHVPWRKETVRTSRMSAVRPTFRQYHHPETGSTVTKLKLQWNR